MAYLEETAISDGGYTDEELLAASLSHPALFSKLVEKYEAPFLRKALSIVRNEEEAEDVVQETFCKIYMYAPKFKRVDGAQFSSWAYRILINTAITHYQKQKRLRGTLAPLDPEIYETLPDGVDTGERWTLTDEIASVFTHMPEGFARALTLHFIDGKPHEEVARLEGVSEGAIKTRVHRAKKEFRNIYESLQGGRK
jgi:RNA polymerase sigma-70 factor (ECF subfamily)